MPTSQNLIWIDLEMTGLNPEKDKILEIAVIITDSNLNIIDESFDVVVHQSKAVMSRMIKYVKNMHGKSGLTKKVLESKISQKEAGKKLDKIIRKYCDKRQGLLCGSSVYVDRGFIKSTYPKINKYLHYRIIDVSSIREVAKRWYPEDVNDYIKHEEDSISHRALDDIKWSINELKFYREKIFKKI